MPATDLPAAGQAPAYLHPVRRHLRTPNRRNVCHVGNSHSLILESASASRTDLHRHRHLYDRLGDFIGRGRLAVAEQPHIRLAAGTLGIAASLALRERSRLALSAPLGLGELLLQLFVDRLQLRNLLLQSLDQRHQLVALSASDASRLAHSRSLTPNPPMRSGLGVGTRGEGRGTRRSALNSEQRGRWRPLVVVGGADGGPGQRRWGGVGGTACRGRQSRTGPVRLCGAVG